ncbi:MAG: cysteine hydrolase family protein [Candidatus Aenigmatarchaeota archaeon]
MAKALIVVDWLEEWRTPGSDYFISDLKEETGRVKRLIQHCRGKGIPVIFIKHVEPESTKEFSGARAELMPELEVGGDRVVVKNHVSPFYQTGLEDILKEMGVEEVIVAGILTNLCVRSLISDAYDRDCRITVIKDCCVSFKPEVQEFTLRDLKETRPEIEFLDLEEFIK